MFEKDLKAKFERIFAVKKVSYDLPSSAREQDCLFVEIEESINGIKDGRFTGRATGNAVMFGQADKIGFGFFSKRIAQSDNEDTKDLFFYELEANTKIYQNIVQRGFSFVYFFNVQYDPELGLITDIEFEESQDA